MRLTLYDMDGERVAYLGDYINVVRDLANLDPDDWGLVRAAMLHILISQEYVFEHNRGIGQKILACFKQKAQQPLYYLTLDTSRNRPNPQFGREEIYPRHQVTVREATYYYSRAALAVLVSEDDSARAIELFESIDDIFVPGVYYRLPEMNNSNVPGSLHRDLVLAWLPVLYDRVGRFEDALSLAPISFDYPGSGATSCDVAVRRLEGWLSQLSEAGGIAAVERFLDLIYEWLDEANDVDEEERGHLSDCPTSTRQFWAWYYGNALGRLIVARPSLRASLLDEITAGEWENCWNIAGVLFETPTESWEEYRQRALKFYNAADIEYSQQGSRPYGVTQPPHLSAQSDLYWAMRVGFADAHSQDAEERRVSWSGIAEPLERIETITSSIAMHGLRTERKIDDLVEAVNNRVIPNDESYLKLLRRDLSDLFESLPIPTVVHLVSALRHQFTKEWDHCRVDLCKSVESLFHQILVPRIQALPESSGLILNTVRGRRSNRRHSEKEWSKIQMYGWAQILETATEGGINDQFRSVLPRAFLNLDMDTVIGLHDVLARIARLRGSSSHDSTTPDDQKAKDAQELWDLVVGSGGEGFLAKFYEAFGLTADDQGSGSGSGC